MQERQRSARVPEHPTSTWPNGKNPAAAMSQQPTAKSNHEQCSQKLGEVPDATVTRTVRPSPT